MAPFVLGLVMLAGWGCQDPIPSGPSDIPGTLWMEVDLQWNGEPFALNENVVDHLGHTLTLNNLQMYISEVELQDMDGVWHRTARPESVHLLDFKTPQPHLLEAFPEGTYQAIRFGVGIPEEINRGTDPALFPNDHPMGFLGSAGMFWTWSTGYIFMKYEGRAAPLGSEVMNSPIAYHCGTDASYRTVSLEFPYPIYIGAQRRLEFPLAFDAAKVLVGPEDSVDVIADPLTHNGPNDPIAARLMDLLTQAWSFQ
ncbi:MAG: hypothetical protein RJA19_1060 [Bacteroidota bacterium]|jgi:hypothetical protein